MIGHSRGGGAIYDLTWRLNQDILEGKITNPFSIEFTAYIDAIEQEDTFVLGIDAEIRGPIGSVFHANYYQTNTFLVFPGIESPRGDSSRRHSARSTR